MTTKYPLHRLPLPTRSLQASLPQLVLEDTPLSQRRSTTFKSASRGIWARVNPLWTSWPLRLTKEEVEAMGVDVDAGEQVSVVDVLKRWDPVDRIKGSPQDDRRRSSQHRLKFEPYLLGVSHGALRDSLPHLDVGDGVQVSTGEVDAEGEVSDARQALVDVVSGRHVVSGDTYGPWSTRYCGHQFGSWAGQLGDGRAISILETTSEDGGRQEIQLKGAGRTPFSRHADGLAVLRSGVREYLGCEAVAALGIPTTRSLALLTAAVPVVRETGPEPPSLLARLAPSFIRIGHFQALNPGREARNTHHVFIGGAYQTDKPTDTDDAFGGHGNPEGLRELAQWCRLILAEIGADVKDTRSFFEEVVRRNAEMVAGWQVYGFCHGVINTDNVSILGLTIDYGPYAFMDVYDESHICNHSDPSGLYNHRNQPSRILFALDKLHQALAPLIGYELEHGKSALEGWADDAKPADVKAWADKTVYEMQGWEEEFWKVERRSESEGWAKRFGLSKVKETDNREIFAPFLSNMHTHNMDFHSTFRNLAHFSPSRGISNGAYIAEYTTELIRNCMVARRAEEREPAQKAFEAWFKVYAARAVEEWEEGEVGEWELKRKIAMQGVNPRFVLRQWVLEEVIQEMEAGLAEGDEAGRMEARAKLNRILQMSLNPFLPYGEDASADNATDSDIAGEQRLCGLGAKEMLGFQCSCSS